ncbi:MAG: ornithine cyclodeaminase family protein [Deltaproteobacteria bacterium]|nr:ornithine cyclodeaminase family protein [Deltaproteobacteria bacterium]MBW2361947.1 ornithine cyclodeaminase family protein [Deltaproteobacteria bacterium]
MAADAGELLYLSQADVEAVAPEPAELVDLVEGALAAVGRGEVAMPPGPALEPRPGAFLHPMIAHAAGADQIGLKWLAGYADNKSQGLPFLTALIVLNDAATGLPIAIMDGDWITAHRTAAASAVAVRRLVGSGAESLSIFGCGVQARSHARVLPVAMPELRRLLVHHPSIDRAREFAATIEDDLPGVEVRAAKNLEEAVRCGRVLLSAGPPQPSPKPVVRAEWLAPDVLFVALDFEAYVSPEVVAAMEHVVTDDAAKLGHFREQGFFASGLPDVSSLGEIVAEAGRPLADRQGRTLFLSLGVAAEDVSVASSVLERARAAGRGVALPR